MKRRLAAAAAGVMLVSMSLSGCQASKGLETDGLKITQYKDVEVEQVSKPEEVTDENVDNMIQAILESNSQVNEITDRAVENGDTVNIDFVGKIDGVEFEGGDGKDYPLTIGSGAFIEGFEDSVIGHKPGETYDWNGAFPDNYGNAEYAGKDVVFTITVNSITESEVPELTDEFVKNVSEESKTVDEYKKEIRKQLEEENETAYSDELASKVWEEVINNTEVSKYPKEKVEKLSGDLIASYKSAADTSGMEYEEFLQSQTGMDVETFEKRVDEVVKDRVKQNMIAEAIAGKENIRLDDSAYEEQLEVIAKNNGIKDVEELKKMASEEELKEMALGNLVMEWLAEHCIQKATE